MEHKTEFFQCACKSHEHMLVVETEWTPDIPGISLSVQLSQFQPFWKRVILALKYVLNMHPTCNGHWDTCLLNDQDVARLQTLLAQYRGSKETKPDWSSHDWA